VLQRPLRRFFVARERFTLEAQRHERYVYFLFPVDSVVTIFELKIEFIPCFLTERTGA